MSRFSSSRTVGALGVLCLAWVSCPDHACAQARAERPDAPAPQTTGTAGSGLRGEWRRAGQGFACRVVSPRQLPHDATVADLLVRACQHIGPLSLGNDAKAVASILGPPHRTLPQPNGVTASIYFLGRPGEYPYLVVSIAQERVVALQVTGPVAAKGYDFNHVELGADTGTLIQHFGPAVTLKPSSEKDTDVWTYGPWPFSFEVKGGRVTSIRISEAGF